MAIEQSLYDLLETAAGWIGVLGSPRGLRRVTPPCRTRQEARQGLGLEVGCAAERPGAFAALQLRLDRYLQGEEVPFDDPLDLEGAPPFFRAAWEACRTIPPGETRSYAWLAARAGRPRATRAAGQAMARNPIAILVPCHRVIGSGGGLHGYGGGLEVKARLLMAESWGEASQRRRADVL